MDFRGPPSSRRRLLSALGMICAIALVAVIAAVGRRIVTADHDSLATRPGATSRPVSKRTLTAKEAIVTERAFTLDENDAVINVTPAPSIDPAGGFLVTDHDEGQLRRYRADGALLWHVGRKGDGPGEFRALIGATRLANGEIAAVDRTRRITLFDAEGNRVLHTVETELTQIARVAAVHDTLLLLAGVAGGNLEGPRLHVVHPRTGAILRSFFAPFRGSPNRVAATTAGFTVFALRGDSIAAVFGVSDTLYIFTLDGEPVRQFPLRADSLRRVPRDGPPAGTQAERFGWLATFDLVTAVHWLPDGFAVAYQSMLPPQAPGSPPHFERQWHLLTLTERGETRLEVRHTPRLLTLAPDGTFYFLDPESETPDRWIEARLRS